MEVDKEKQKTWWKRKELWGTVISVVSVSPDLINWAVGSNLLPEYTLLAKLSLPIGLILTALGLRKGFNSQNLIFQKNAPEILPEGLRKNPFKKKEDYIGDA